jgi:hypothetical protein
MSYNIYVEGDLDFVTLSAQTSSLQSIEMFPIIDEGKPDALGIALPSSRANDNARAELTRIVGQLIASESTVIDLMTGQPVTNVAQLIANIFG